MMQLSGNVGRNLIFFLLGPFVGRHSMTFEYFCTYYEAFSIIEVRLERLLKKTGSYGIFTRFENKSMKYEKDMKVY